MKRGFILPETLIVILLSFTLLLITLSIAKMRVNEEEIINNVFKEIEENYELCLNSIFEIEKEDQY